MTLTNSRKRLADFAFQDITTDFERLTKLHRGKDLERATLAWIQWAPLVYNSEGVAIAGDLTERLQQISGSELANAYLDLYPHHLRERLASCAPKRSGFLAQTLQKSDNQFMTKIARPALKPVVVGSTSTEIRTLSLEPIPGALTSFRGCLGADCSILSVPAYSAHKDVHVAWVRKSASLTAQPEGYALWVMVERNGKKVPYILTVNGAALSEADIRQSVRMVARLTGSKEVLLPDFSKPATQALVNTPASRNGMTFPKSTRVTPQMPKGWDKIEKFQSGEGNLRYQNYYRSEVLQNAVSVKVDYPESAQILQPEVRYPRPESLESLPLLERGIFAVQAEAALGYSEADLARRRTIERRLGVTPEQVQAIEPFVNAEPGGTHLQGNVIKRLEKEYGVGLEILEALEPTRASGILQDLYGGSKGLAKEAQWRQYATSIGARLAKRRAHPELENAEGIGRIVAAEASLPPSLYDGFWPAGADALIDHPDPAVRKAAMEALSGNSNAYVDQMTNYLPSRWSDPRPDVRAWTMTTLQRFERWPEGGQAAILRGLSDESPLVRAQAAWTLGANATHRPPNTPQLLLDLVDDPDAAVRKQSIWALSRQSEIPQEIPGRIAKGLTDSQPEVRLAWAQLTHELIVGPLQYRPPQQVHDSILRLLRSEVSANRQNGFELLRVLYDSKPELMPGLYWPHLSQLLTESDPRFQKALHDFLRLQGPWSDEFWESTLRLIEEQKLSTESLRGFFSIARPIPEDLQPRLTQALLKGPGSHLEAVFDGYYSYFKFGEGPMDVLWSAYTSLPSDRQLKFLNLLSGRARGSYTPAMWEGLVRALQDSQTSPKVLVGILKTLVTPNGGWPRELWSTVPALLDHSVPEVRNFAGRAMAFQDHWPPDARKYAARVRKEGHVDDRVPRYKEWSDSRYVGEVASDATPSAPEPCVRSRLGQIWDKIRRR